MNANSFRVLSLIALLVLSSCGANYTFEELATQPPLRRIEVAKRNGVVEEVFVSLEAGERLTNVVDVSFFDGLDHRMTHEAARKRFGEPQGVRTDPLMRLSVAVYPVPKGEIGFMSVPTSGGMPNQPQVWAYPTNQSPAAVILDESVRRQLVTLLSGDRAVQVHVLREVGAGRVTLNMSSNRVDALILGPRDGE